MVTGPVEGPGPPADPIWLQKEVLNLRKRALPYDLIADHLGISEDEAKRLGKKAISALKQDDVAELDLARRLQIEQLEAMIAAIYAQATGSTIYGDRLPVQLEAIDRMVKLLDAKAKLLGLNAPQRIDIDARLVVMAEHLGADVEELREIANDVLAGAPPSFARPASAASS